MLENKEVVEVDLSEELIAVAKEMAMRAPDPDQEAVYHFLKGNLGEIFNRVSKVGEIYLAKQTKTP